MVAGPVPEPQAVTVELPPGVLTAQVANAVLAAATLCTAQGLPMQVAFLDCGPLSVSFQASYAQHGRRRYLLALADASGAKAQLMRLDDSNEVDMTLFDPIDEAFTTAFPEALRVTVGALLRTTFEHTRHPGLCRAPEHLQ